MIGTPKPTPRYVEKAIKKRNKAANLARVRAVVKSRDNGRCRVPGCTKTTCDLHHLRFRSAGGDDSTSNLYLLCREHHRAVHQHVLKVYGTDANGTLTFEWHEAMRGLR